MNDDTLILYYYGDGLTERERRDVAAALEADATLAARFAALCRELGDWRGLPPAAAPDDLRRRLHESVDIHAREANARPVARRLRQRGFRLPAFAWGAAVAAALAIGIGIGIGLRIGGEAPPVAVAAGDPFLRGMQVYLADTRREIDALATSPAGDRTQLILQIIDQNRLYERTARQNGAADLARVLRAFEPVLVRLAAGDTAPEDAEALRAQLAFELNVMLTKLAAGPSKETTTT
jgi:hypothetical protein